MKQGYEALHPEEALELEVESRQEALSHPPTRWTSRTLVVASVICLALGLTVSFTYLWVVQRAQAAAPYATGAKKTGAGLMLW